MANEGRVGDTVLRACKPDSHARLGPRYNVVIMQVTMVPMSDGVSTKSMPFVDI